MRLLLAEDERDLNAIITQKLTQEGYSVDCCFDGESALDYLAMVEYDVLILDIMMPKVDGYAVLKSLRDQGDNTPVLFLTAKDAIQDKVLGLDMGANDYLVKPFSFEELLARLRVLTRASFGQMHAVLSCADLTLDTASHVVKRGKQIIHLSMKEFQLLEYLMYNQGIVLSRETIENHIWDFDYEGGTNVVDVYISYLRKKVDIGEKKLIHTVRGKGYVLKEED